MGILFLLASLFCSGSGPSSIVCNGDTPVEVLVDFFSYRGAQSFYRECVPYELPPLITGPDLTCFEEEGPIGVRPDLWSGFHCSWDGEPETPRTALYINGHKYGYDSNFSTATISASWSSTEGLTFSVEGGGLPLYVYKSQDPYIARTAFWFAYHGKAGEFTEENFGCSYTDPTLTDGGLWFYSIVGTEGG